MKKPLSLCLFFIFFTFSVSAIGDPAREEARIQKVYDEFGLCGEGVIIAILDRGIDPSHPAFLDVTGQTRLAYIYDMTNPTGENDNPYGIGTIFTEADINADLVNGPMISTSFDFGGHGTATTSIACGSGDGADLNVINPMGVAPCATIISVKLINDPFPAGDGQEGQAGFFNPDYIDEALQFVHDKGVELGLPVVALMNFGSIGGPTDGSSAVCQAMDNFIDQGNLLVCGVGDDGGADNAAEGFIPTGGVAEVLDVRKEEAGNLRFELWYPGSNLLDLLIVRPDETSTPIIFDNASPDHATNDVLSDMSIFRRGANVDFAGAASDRKQILIDITGDTGVYRIHLSTPQMVDVPFFASLNPALYNNGNRFLNFIRNGGSINDYASALNVIAPSDYVADNTWTDINGVNRSKIGEGDPGEIWIGSSKGLTQDGRIGVDFAAPGEVLYAAYSPNTFYSRFAFNTLQGSNGLYGIQNAVSAAAPLTTGVIALLLELKPDLTQAEVKDILQLSARQDSFTGDVPNNCWGHGKLDAFAAAEEVFRLVSNRNPTVQQLRLFPNPTAGNYLMVANTASLDALAIYEVSGKHIRNCSTSEVVSGQINVNSLLPGIYLLSGQGENGRYVARFVKK